MFSFQPEKPGFNYKRRREPDDDDDGENVFLKKKKASELELIKGQPQLSEETRAKIAQMVEEEEPEVIS